MVFILLILAFWPDHIVLNINTGNVHISLSEIIDILLKKATDTKEYSIIWKIRLPRIDGCHSWRCLIPIWFSSSDLF